MHIIIYTRLKALASTIPQPRVCKESTKLSGYLGDTSVVYFCCESDTPGTSCSCLLFYSTMSLDNLCTSELLVLRKDVPASGLDTYKLATNLTLGL